MRGDSPAPQAAYVDALRRLARRDHSEAELRRALLRAGHDEDVAEATITRLRRERALDDERFAGRWAVSRMQSHGLGRHRVRAGLIERGISRALTDQALRRALEDVPEAEALDGIARRYWNRSTAVPPPVRLRRLFGLLLRRGFPAALVAERLRALFPRRRSDVAALEEAAIASADSEPRHRGDRE